MNRFWLALIVCCFSLPCIAAPRNKHKEPPSFSEDQVASLVLYAPHPEYPREARLARVTGSGLFQMVIADSGRVTAVRVLKTTGSKILDDSAVRTLSRWRFKAGSGLQRANQPLTFYR